jgi:hypothetical protein
MLLCRSSGRAKVFLAQHNHLGMVDVKSVSTKACEAHSRLAALCTSCEHKSIHETRMSITSS